MPTFEQSLEMGVAGESWIASWLRSRGNTVLPVYEKIVKTGKGPQLYLPEKELIAPDLFVFKSENAFWIEAKHKTAFTLHRKSGRWVTGIDLRHYEHYLKVDQVTPWDVWLLFLHRGGQAKDSPPGSPAGLFGNALKILAQHENHRHANGGRAGMVYWDRNSLILLANLQGEVPEHSIFCPEPEIPITHFEDIKTLNQKNQQELPW